MIHTSYISVGVWNIGDPDAERKKKISAEAHIEHVADQLRDSDAMGAKGIILHLPRRNINVVKDTLASKSFQKVLHDDSIKSALLFEVVPTPSKLKLETRLKTKSSTKSKAKSDDESHSDSDDDSEKTKRKDKHENKTKTKNKNKDKDKDKDADQTDCHQTDYHQTDVSYCSPEQLNKLYTTITKNKLIPPSKWGVVLDTCHLWGSGISVGDASQMQEWFDRLDHPEMIKCIHLNGGANDTFDSGKDEHMPPFCKLDNIFKEHRPMKDPEKDTSKKSGIKVIVKFAKKYNVPIICELEKWDESEIIKSIKLIRKL
jgi:hypothetical protein